MSLAVGFLAGYFWRPIAQVAQADRISLYSSAAEIVAVVGGLGSIAVSTYVGMSGRRIKALQQESGAEVNSNLAWFIIATAVSAFSCWIAQVLEIQGLRTTAWIFVVVAILWSFLTMFRQAWLFSNLVGITQADQAEDGAVNDPGGGFQGFQNGKTSPK